MKYGEETKTKCNKKQTVKNMIDTKATISIIILHVKGLNIPIKDKECQNGYKNKTWLYVVYKKSTLNIKTSIKNKAMLYHANIN